MKKVITLKGEINRMVINDIAELIHSIDDSDEIILIFSQTNIVVVDDYLYLIDLLNYANKHCYIKAFFYGILNFKHLPLMQIIDSEMGENSIIKIEKEDVTKFTTTMRARDELIADLMMGKAAKIMSSTGIHELYDLETEDVVLTGDGCEEMGLLEKRNKR